MSASAAVRGWCPGALRPMQARDGLLARVRVSAGRLSLARAEAVAAAARDCGNGTIEISSRANLQLRGVTEAKLGELQTRLAAVELIDADPTVERVRNIVASPLGDLNSEAILDVGPVVAALEARLAVDESLRALPAKFGFLIDAGGRWPLGDVEADVQFEAFAAAEGARFAVWLAPPHPRGRGVCGAGSSPLPASCGEGPGVEQAARRAIVAPHDLPEVAARLARAFLALAGKGPEAPRRMRALAHDVGAAAVFAAAGIAADPVIGARRIASPRDTVGVLALGARVGLGVAPPFGRMQSDAFAELACAARSEGASGLRLTPWRTIVVVGLEATRAPTLARRLDALGFIIARDDPILSVVACPGAPACAHAERDTHVDARNLSGWLPNGGVALHVSGCAKGCARAAPTPLTLVAKTEGYDLVVDGRAGDAPAYCGLSFDQASMLVKSLIRGSAA